jgi:hypothetical protein
MGPCKQLPSFIALFFCNVWRQGALVIPSACRAMAEGGKSPVAAQTVWSKTGGMC